MKTYLQITLLLIVTTQIVFSGTYGGGNGSSENPYKISTASHLYELYATSGDWGMGIYFIQTADITVTGEWTPIGNSTTNFRGSYDGQGFTISGITITNQFRNGYWGCFGYTNGATIKNLGLLNINIDEKSEVGGIVAYATESSISNCYTTGSVVGYFGYVGGLVAETYGTSITNCYSSATVTGGSSGSGSYTGGLIGRCTNSSPVSNSYHITGNVSGRDYVGGLIGGLESSSSVSQCYSSGSVTGTSIVGGLIGTLSASVDNSYSRANVSNSGSYSGGLVGQITSGSIEKCYSTGTASGSSFVGGLLGSTTGGTVSNSFWDTETSALGSSAGGTGKTTSEMKTQSTFTGAGWSFPNIWMITSLLNDAYPTLLAPASGDGTSGNPYQIANWQNLYWISQNSSKWDKYFIQTSNINFSAASPAIETWDGNKGWKPIGNASTHFTGSYNGDYKTISELYISRSGESNVGFFGLISGSGDKVKNLGLLNIDIAAGGGYNGGLVGQFSGGNISNSYTTGSINTSSMYNGGFVGHSSATITQSYSTVNLNTGSASGGFVGFTGSGTSISDCYARGNVTATSNVGGFSGYANEGSISNCYSTGSITASSSYGGFSGNGWLVNLSSSFWDNQTSGQSSTWGAAVGKTTTEMKTQSTFLNAGWSSLIWNMDNDINDGYPYLDWQNPSGNPLPVELISFTVNVENNFITLRWETATEINNYGFEVERLTSQVNDWEKIGFVQGHGNSNSTKVYSFIDDISSLLNNLTDKSLSYRLKQIDNNGIFKYSNTVVVNISPNSYPEKFALYQNYPNPFNPFTTIEYSIPQVADAYYASTTNVILKVYDFLGNEVTTLVNEYKAPGKHKVTFDANRLTAGVYFYTLRAGEFFRTEKMLLIK